MDPSPIPVTSFKDDPSLSKSNFFRTIACFSTIAATANAGREVQVQDGLCEEEGVGDDEGGRIREDQKQKLKKVNWKKLLKLSKSLRI